MAGIVAGPVALVALVAIMIALGAVKEERVPPPVLLDASQLREADHVQSSSDEEDLVADHLRRYCSAPALGGVGAAQYALEALDDGGRPDMAAFVRFAAIHPAVADEVASVAASLLRGRPESREEADIETALEHAGRVVAIDLTIDAIRVASGEPSSRLRVEFLPPPRPGS